MKTMIIEGDKMIKLKGIKKYLWFQWSFHLHHFDLQKVLIACSTFANSVENKQSNKGHQQL